MRTVPPTEKGKYKAFASGAITNGKPVVVNADGTVKLAGTSVTISAGLGSAVTFESASARPEMGTFDSNSNKVVVTYQDIGNSNYGTAVIGTIDDSDNSISFGTPVVFESATTDSISSVFDSSNNKVVIGYRDGGNSYYGTAIVGTVSGTAISFGTAVVFKTATTFYTSAVFDTTAGKVTISYQDIGNTGDGTVSAGTVSGTAISFDAAVVVSTGNVQYLNSVYDPTDNKVVMAYSDNASSDDGYSVVYGNASTNLTASNFLGIADEAISASASGVIVVQGGTATYPAQPALSAGDPVQFESGSNSYNASVFDSNANKIVAFYDDSGNS